MEGLSIIETDKIRTWELRLTNMEQMLLMLVKSIQDSQPEFKSNVPDFISISKAAKKYDLSRTTLYNKIKLFCKLKGRDIDRLQTGNINKVNEAELIEAIRIKGDIPLVFQVKRKK